MNGDWKVSSAALLTFLAVLAALLPAAAAAYAGPLTDEPGDKAPASHRYIVRLVETSGRATVAHLHFASAVDASETDLLEDELPDGFRAHGEVLDVPEFIPPG